MNTSRITITTEYKCTKKFKDWWIKERLPNSKAVSDVMSTGKHKMINAIDGAEGVTSFLVEDL